MTPNMLPAAAALSDRRVSALNTEFATASAEDILAWSWQTLGPHIAASSSFQTQSLPLLHMISRMCPEMPVIFLDTGFHFPETLRFRDEIVTRYGLRLVVASPAIGQAELMRIQRTALYRTDPDMCCYVNKVEPMERCIRGFSGWVSGVRRVQTKERSRMQVLHYDTRGTLRIHPLFTWSDDMLDRYMRVHALPKHPLHDRGFLSIGCAPCTRAVAADEESRAGRWPGSAKTECGLHLARENEGHAE